MSQDSCSYVRGALAALGLLLSASGAEAADLTTFHDLHGESGYVVLADPADATSVSRVHLLPQLCGPARRAASDRCAEAGVRADADSATVTWVLESTAPSESFLPTLYQDLVVQWRREGRVPSGGMPVLDLVRARDVTVRMRVHGEVVAERRLTGSLSPHHVGTLRVSGDRDVVDAVKRGELTLEAEMTVPFGSYGALSVRVDDRIAHTSRVEAFRKVVQTTTTRGGHFLFSSWKRTSRKRFEEQMLAQSSNEQSESATSVLMIDPDPAMDRRLDEILGLVRKERSAFFAAHRAAAAAAGSRGRPDLQALHVDYLKAVETGDNDEQDRILRMMTALASEDVAGFLAAGVAFSSGNGYARDEFHAVATTAHSARHSGRYREVRVTTALARYNVSTGELRDVPALLSAQRHEALVACFGSAHPSQGQATSCLWTAIGRGDLEMVTRALQERAHVNGRDAAGRTPLMRAAMRGDEALVALLLRWDASPAQRDADGLSAADHAFRAGHDALARRLRGAEEEAAPVAVSLSVELEQPGYILGVEATGEGGRYQGQRELTLSLSPGEHALEVVVRARVFVPQAVARLAIQRGMRPFSWGAGGAIFDVEARVPYTLVVTQGAPASERIRIAFDVVRGRYSV